VAIQDQALSHRPNKVVMWSYPIVRDGLIYVVDVRSGLYCSGAGAARWRGC
jgi:hypothetical protein